MLHPTIRKLVPIDSPAMLNILNHYALHSVADFSDEAYTQSDITTLLNASEHFPKYAAEIEGKVIGFGMAYPFRSEGTFAGTAKFTYWLDPDFTGQGIGSELYDNLERDCEAQGITNILVNISSENAGSIRFHERRGYTLCGRFRNVANKLGRRFDMLWYQKQL